MITQLSIRGLAIIEELHIEFSPQLNVITGETGAGKSILIKALHLLLGAKADPDVIRRGFERAHVAANFLLPRDHGSVLLLEEHGLLHEDQDLIELILRREINQKGRSHAWVNDQPVTLALLKDIGQTLIDIYGQHENHRMLDPSTHIEYIDQFLKDGGSKVQLGQIMGAIQSLVQTLRKRLEQYLNKRREQDFLQFRFNELAQFEPSAEDFSKVTQVCQDASLYVSEQKILQQAQRVCDEGYQGRALSSALSEVLRLLEQSKWLKLEGGFQDQVAEIRALSRSLDELSYVLGRASGRHLIEEDELENYQERLAGYQALQRKLGVRSIEELLSEYERLQRELSFVQVAPEEFMQMVVEIQQKCKEADRIARKLSEDRKKAAQKAVTSVVKELHDLNMKGAQIDFEFQAIKQSVPDLDLQDFSKKVEEAWNASVDVLTETSRTGREKGQFLLAANPGEGFKALAKVASGGEISRIMLGFKRALAMGANTCVMVFDEIDTGISGHTAHIVGKKLKELSTSFQVVCISHLPQVAVYGDAHFKVEKAQKGKSTESRIFKLTQIQSEEEIARLLSGDQVTSSSLVHAKQLIQSARALNI